MLGPHTHHKALLTKVSERKSRTKYARDTPVNVHNTSRAARSAIHTAGRREGRSLRPAAVRGPSLGVRSIAVALGVPEGHQDGGGGGGCSGGCSSSGALSLSPGSVEGPSTSQVLDVPSVEAGGLIASTAVQCLQGGCEQGIRAG